MCELAGHQLGHSQLSDNSPFHRHQLQRCGSVGNSATNAMPKLIPQNVQKSICRIKRGEAASRLLHRHPPWGLEAVSDKPTLCGSQHWVPSLSMEIQHYHWWRASISPWYLKSYFSTDWDMSSQSIAQPPTKSCSVDLASHIVKPTSVGGTN